MDDLAFHIELEGVVHPAPPWKRTRTGMAISYAYFCPQCGRIWARAYRPDMTGWATISAVCAMHPSTRFHIAGELYTSFGSEVNDSLPPALQRRELELNLAHLSFIDRLNKGL